MRHESRLFEIFRVFLKLGCLSFGGPVAHLGYFQNEFVRRRQWISDEAYADLVTLCQVLPGPASSQVGLAIGWKRGGWMGAAAAWLGFTLPSALIMTAFAYGLTSVVDPGRLGWLQGLKIAAVAVVGQAVLTMARKLCPDGPRAAIAILATVALIVWQGGLLQIGAIGAGAILGWVLLRRIDGPGETASPSGPPTRSGLICLSLFIALLVLAPLAARLWPNPETRMFSSFYRAGALVFGGGHVVLPFLERATVLKGSITQDAFLSGYGAAQALPGPLFSFSAFLGTLIAPGGPGGAALALVSIYLPGVLILFGALPYWDRLRASVRARRLLAGANAAVVGLLAAALYSPIGVATLTSPGRIAMAAVAFVLLQWGRASSWIVVAACAAAGAIWLG